VKYLKVKNLVPIVLGSPRNRLLLSAFSTDSRISVLDVGGGMGMSLNEISSVFPNVEYSCVDLIEEDDFLQKNHGRFKNYWKINLASLDFGQIPDNYFDVVICSHIIEHLFNGDAVLQSMSKKIKLGGYIYVEYPCQNSLHLPSMPGTLNFMDDNTHCRLYTEVELVNLFIRNGVLPIKSGVRRNWIRILVFPLLIIYKILFRNIKSTIAYEFWDICGFAEFIFAQRIDRRSQIDPLKFIG
jgi:SAM-dependent methyltransferase